MQLTHCDFTFVCARKWDDLEPTFTPAVRFCDQCSKDVFLVKNDAQLAQAKRLGRCVAWLRPTASKRHSGPDQLLGDVVP
jgi:hypothetical protein